jgi:hypothetical protein
MAVSVSRDIRVFADGKSLVVFQAIVKMVQEFLA